MRVLLLIPPMTQLNTPYPSTAYLSGFLKTRGYTPIQKDLSLMLALRVFSSAGLGEMAQELRKKYTSKKKASAMPASVEHFLANEEAYLGSVDGVIRLLQGKDSSLALRFVSRNFLPEGPKFSALENYAGLDANELESGDPLGWAFGSLGTLDRAKYFASLFIADLAAMVRDGIDEHFEMVRYGEKLAASQPSFDTLHAALESKTPSLLDRWMDEIVLQVFEESKPDLVGFTAPFPGNVYASFRMARALKNKDATIKTMLGGGWVNTELRQLSEARVFDYFDFISLDDGERPLLSLLEFIEGKRSEEKLFRTYIRKNGKVLWMSNTEDRDIPHKSTGTPSYVGLDMGNYLSILEMLNPMHRVWSDGRWNKLTLAHGCYWKKCSFCDVSLDYIARYETAPADLIIDRMLSVMSETGSSGFHFVDEAAPPAMLEALSKRMLERKVVSSWWTNIRFDKTFTPELCQLMAAAGCVAVTGGLEVASDRLLKLMKKGVTVEQVACVSKAFADAGIMVHAYLMYGFPTQSVQESIDSLERVRQLFAEGCLQSAFWHRFSATAHSPIGLNPAEYGITLIKPKNIKFALNDLDFEDATGVDHDSLGEGLKRALYNYMHGLGLDVDVRTWFEKKLRVPKAKVSPTLIADALVK